MSWPRLAKAYASIAKQVSVPGFRVKVPARVIEQRFGRGAVLEEAINDAVPKAYEDALREKEIVPVGRPEVDVTEIEDGEKVTFTAEVDIRPEFELPDQGDHRGGDAAEASDADIDEHIDNLRTRFASRRTLTGVRRRGCPAGGYFGIDRLRRRRRRPLWQCHVV